MDLHPAGAHDVALFCGQEDLSRNGFSPYQLTLSQAMLLLRQAGLPPPAVDALEVFPTQQGALIFAHLKSCTPSRPTPPRPLRPGRLRRPT